MRTSPFTQALDAWWTSRVESYRRGELTDDDIVTIRGILYLMRRVVGVENMPKQRSAFYAAIDRVERRHGVPREELKIVTEPKIELIPIRGDSKPILEASRSEISDVCALLYCEKSTILKAIESDRSLTDRGIAIVKAMGFSTREVNRMIKLAQELGVPILFLTDLDCSGILIELKVREAGVETHRLGIDLDLIKELGLSISDVNEPMPTDPKKLNHFKYLCSIDPKWYDFFVNVIGDGRRPYRIEIDGVFSFAGKVRFVEAILRRADEVVERKPLQKVLLPRTRPRKVDSLFWRLSSALTKIYEDIIEEETVKYRDVAMPFVEIRIREIESEIERVIDEKGETDEVVAILDDALTRLGRLRSS